MCAGATPYSSKSKAGSVTAVSSKRIVVNIVGLIDWATCSSYSYADIVGSVSTDSDRIVDTASSTTTTCIIFP
jgi:hypothetical protein